MLNDHHGKQARDADLANGVLFVCVRAHVRLVRVCVAS